jgi:hypothetical protein
MFRPFPSISILTLSSMAGLVYAQPVDLRAPIAGFVYNRELRSVRPLFGMAGSALIGPPILSGVDSASIAPGGKWALINTDGRGRLVRRLSDLAPIESTGQDLIEAVDRVVWNRAGSFALLYSSSTRQLQRVRLSEKDALADPPLSISWGDVTSLAIDAAGRQIAIGVAETGLYLWTSEQPSPTLLPSIAQPGAVAFDENGRLYAIDTATQRILNFDSASGMAEFTSFAETDAPALDPVGLAVSKGGRYLLLADRPSHSVRVYETASKSLIKTIPLDFAPSRFELLSSEPSFLLNEPGSKEWLLILNAGDSPSVSFVPAGQEEAR